MHFERLKYSYDKIGRLVSEKNLDGNREICYTYDNSGNILTKTDNGTVTDYRYKDGTDRLMSFGTELFAYDDMGNPTTYRNMSCVWEKGRQLKSISDGANTVSFTYDEFGMRTTKTAGGITTNYVYENGKLLREVTGSEKIDFVYGSDGIIGFRTGNKNYLYRKNVFGDVTEIYSDNGTLVGKYSYTAFGECIVKVNEGGIAEKNPIRYRGYYYDEEMSLYYLKSRYYDPVTGRFMTIDGIDYIDPETINGLNLYAYCGNNPVMRVDENGNAWWHWLIGGLALVGGAILCFVPGGQALGVALLVSGVSSTASNIMTAAGVNGKVASLISSGLNIVAGIALCFTPFAGIGASMIGSGIGGIAGGYISEALGGSFELGSIIGSVLGGIIGGKVYDGIKIAQLSKNGVVVLGEGMSRVRATAATTGAGTYGGMPGFAKLSKILPKQLMNQLGLAHNARWINWVGKAGVDIIDIGICGNNSANYLMEILHIGKWLF